MEFYSYSRIEKKKKRREEEERKGSLTGCNFGRMGDSPSRSWGQEIAHFVTRARGNQPLNYTKLLPSNDPKILPWDPATRRILCAMNRSLGRDARKSNERCLDRDLFTLRCFGRKMGEPGRIWTKPRGIFEAISYLFLLTRHLLIYQKMRRNIHLTV